MRMGQNYSCLSTPNTHINAVTTYRRFCGSLGTDDLGMDSQQKPSVRRCFVKTFGPRSLRHIHDQHNGHGALR